MLKETRRKGVLTVEAAIILPVFMMVIFFVLSVMKLFYFHLVMQQALQNVGRTLSQYGYVVDELVGLESFTITKETQAAEEGLKQGVDTVIADSQELINYLGGKFTLDTLDAIIRKGGEFGNHLEELGDTIESVKNDPKIIINYLLVSAAG